MNKYTNARIIELMEDKQIMSVKDLSSALDVTEVTIRRNLNELQELGYIKRERGFAILQDSGKKTDYFIESSEHSIEKKAIAQAALQFISPSLSLCIDSGTTTQALLELIPEDLSLSIITTSIIGALSLSNKKNAQVLLPQGFMHHSNRSILLTDRTSLDNYRADIAFMSCRSFCPPLGAFELTPTLASTKEALSNIASKIILLADYSKWGINLLCNTIPMSKIDTIITDDKAPTDMIQECRNAGKQVIVAQLSHT